MADNVTLPGTGAVIASDDDGTAQHQYVKLEFGADNVRTKVDATNPLPVTVISGGDGSVQGVDAHDAAVTADPVLIGAYAKAAAPTDVSADGDAVRVWALRSGAVCTQPTAGGTLIAAGNGTAATAMRVTLASDGTGVVGATCTGNVAHDGVASGNPVRVAAYASAAAPTNVSADGDVVNLWALRNGAICNQPTCSGTLVAAGNGTNAAAMRVTIASDSTGVVGATCTGAAAHGAAVSGNPVLQGLEARTAVGTAVTNGQAVRALADVFGKQVVLVGALLEEFKRGAANLTTTGSSTLIAAQGAGKKFVLLGLSITNAHATVGTKVTLTDGTTSHTVYASAAGGGIALDGSNPILITAANTALTVSAGTTGADVDVTVWGYVAQN